MRPRFVIFAKTPNPTPSSVFSILDLGMEGIEATAIGEANGRENAMNIAAALNGVALDREASNG